MKNNLWNVLAFICCYNHALLLSAPHLITTVGPMKGADN